MPCSFSFHLMQLLSFLQPVRVPDVPRLTWSVVLWRSGPARTVQGGGRQSRSPGAGQGCVSIPVLERPHWQTGTWVPKKTRGGGWNKGQLWSWQGRHIFSGILQVSQAVTSARAGVRLPGLGNEEQVQNVAAATPCRGNCGHLVWDKLGNLVTESLCGRWKPWAVAPAHGGLQLGDR